MSETEIKPVKAWAIVEKSEPQILPYGLRHFKIDPLNKEFSEELYEQIEVLISPIKPLEASGEELEPTVDWKATAYSRLKGIEDLQKKLEWVKKALTVISESDITNDSAGEILSNKLIAQEALSFLESL